MNSKVICKVCESRMERIGGISSSPTRNFMCKSCGAHDYEVVEHIGFSGDPVSYERRFFTKAEWEIYIEWVWSK